MLEGEIFKMLLIFEKRAEVAKFRCRELKIENVEPGTTLKSTYFFWGLEKRDLIFFSILSLTSRIPFWIGSNAGKIRNIL